MMSDAGGEDTTRFSYLSKSNVVHSIYLSRFPKSAVLKGEKYTLCMSFSKTETDG